MRNEPKKMIECLADKEFIDMSIDDIISGIVLQPFKPEIVNDIAVLDSVFETDKLGDDEYSFIGPYIYKYWELGIEAISKETHDQLSIFRLCVIGTEAYSFLNDLYIPTTRDTGHTSNTLVPLHIVHISLSNQTAACEDAIGHNQDPLIKALLLMNIPINSDCLLLDDTLVHLREIVALSGLDVEIQVKHSVSLKHKKLLSTNFGYDNPLTIISVLDQKKLSEELTRYFPMIHLPTSVEDATNQIDTGNLKMSSLQSFCIYQNLKLSVSKVFQEQGLYSNKGIFIELDKVHFQLKNTGSLNFKIGALVESHDILEVAFWQLLNKGLIFDLNSFKKYVELKEDETSKTDVYTNSKNDNIPFNSTYYELLLRLVLDESLKPSVKRLEVAIQNKDFDSAINIIRELPFFKA